MLTFISGGVRSGKSAYAERLLTGREGRLVYIASGVAFDPEMQKRIEQHREDRSLANWMTIEQPVDLEKVLPKIKTGDLVLWDCLTTWLANEMYQEDCWELPGCLEEKQRRVLQTVQKICGTAEHFVIVSNEVLDEWPQYEEETEVYRKAIGSLHRRLVEIADTAIEMDHGVPVFWKGEVG